MSRFMASRYSALKAYTPGEQPTDMKYIKLNTNESPFPPSPGVIKAISAEQVEDLRLYSDPECGKLRQVIAKQFGFEKENVFVSNGSDDILNFSFMAFCENGVAFPEISYGFYPVFAKLNGIPYKEIPLRDDFSIDYRDYVGIGMNIVIANPNAPTGIAMPLAEIEEILKSNPENIVIIDEAYVDFGAESSIALLSKYDNLIVTQTFSKSRSMAGARLGFGVSSPDIIRDLNTIKYSTNPYNVNRMTLAAGCAAISDNKYYMDNCRIIIENREWTTCALRELGFSVLDSSANFIFAKTDRIGGEELYLRLKEMGILVRHFKKEAIKDYNRITIGTKEEMMALIDAVSEILERKVT